MVYVRVIWQPLAHGTRPKFSAQVSDTRNELFRFYLHRFLILSLLLYYKVLFYNKHMYGTGNLACVPCTRFLDWQFEADTHKRECDHCEWNGRLTKPQMPETNISFSTLDIQETDLTKCGIVQIIHCILVKSVPCLPTCLLSIIVYFSFSFICIARGNKEGNKGTQLMCGGIFNMPIVHRLHQ